MRRREFIAVLGAGTLGGPLAAPLTTRAQSVGTTRRLGVLMGIAESDPIAQTRIQVFRSALEELKWVEGNNLLIDMRWGASDPKRIQAHAAELAALAPDAIFTANTPPTRALQQATRTIPIVFVGVSDPVGDSFVASLAKPGGNITGFSNMDAAMAGKWLQLLKEVSPGLERIAILYNPQTAPHSVFLPALEAAALPVGITLVRATVREPGAIDGTIAALAALASAPVAGLAVMPDVFTTTNRALIIASAARHRVPTIYPFAFAVAQGGLMSYGPDSTDQYQRAGSYIDRILKGARPADLPVQVPTKFEFTANLKTANALGITFPPSVLARADEVIE